MSIIYNNQGFDVSDDGKQMKSVENYIDFKLFLKKLPEIDQQIAGLIVNGYNNGEIAKILKIGKKRIYDLKTKLDKSVLY